MTATKTLNLLTSSLLDWP